MILSATLTIYQKKNVFIRISAREWLESWKKSVEDEIISERFLSNA